MSTLPKTSTTAPIEDDEEYSKKPELNYEDTRHEIGRLLETLKDKNSIHQPKGGIGPSVIVNMTFDNKKDIPNKEFNQLQKLPIYSSIAFKRAPPVKNRYTDIPCLDNNRVVLQTTENDYIHANFVDGYRQSKAYICCQGPVQQTIEDFWQMIWQENILVIAMLTKCIELNKPKCEQYWPNIVNETSRYGVYIVHCKTRALRKYYEYTEIRLTNTASPNQNGTSNSRSVIHFLFTEWPDRGVPNNCHKFLEFVHLVRKGQIKCLKLKPEWKDDPLGPPIVVHCSAGIGRTGTFCAVDISCQKLHDTRRADVFETVKLMRTQRAKAVQKDEQYSFIYLCIVMFVQKANIYTLTKGESKQMRMTQLMLHVEQQKQNSFHVSKP